QPISPPACDSIRPSVCLPVYMGRWISILCVIGDSRQREGLLPLGTLVAAVAAMLPVNGSHAGKAELQRQRFADANDLFFGKLGKGSEYPKRSSHSFGGHLFEGGKETRTGIRV